MRCNLIKVAGVATAILSTLGMTNAHAEMPLSGSWVIGNGAGVLVIQGSSWQHPKMGNATVRHGTSSADIQVFYHGAQGIRCAYRAYLTASGEKLVLEPADGSQSPEYCPQGELSRVSGRIR